MVSVVVYVVVTAIVAAVVYALATIVFGRGEALPPIATGETLTCLPTEAMSGDDVRSLKFRVSARGYNMAEVDWAIAELAAEIDRLRQQLPSEPSSTNETGEPVVAAATPPAEPGAQET